MKITDEPTNDYEVLSYDAVVELMDPEGREAVYVRKEHIRFLRDHVSTLEDYGWGSGIAFAGHEVYPGSLAQRQIIGSRLRSTVRLTHRYRRGDELTFSVERVIKNGFISPSECWLEAELYHPVQHVSLRVILPGTRAVQAARLVRPGRPGSMGLRVKHLPRGRQCISYDDRHPAQGQRYTVLWEW
jgi:hypothetical protein